MNGSYDICFSCGYLYGYPKKGAMGIWAGRCSICGIYTGLANARHDYGLDDEAVEQVIEDHETTD